jgi:Ca2+-binding RTX toxin-like protein
VKSVIVALALASATVFPAAAIADTTHKGWPKFDTMVWITKTDRITTHHGGAKNDEILGGHRDDTLFGERGRDVLWGDYKPSGQGTSQHDALDGGSGNDFIYASHGYNTIRGGTGADIIHSHFGRGRIDCGPGHDILFISHRARRGYEVSRCETISYNPAAKG